ncbi:MAG: V-type ATP synthase subunit K [Lentisphaeria bacterium]|nr:V-type ATP synthase subunit K [Lentisphaeria bacterium]
MGNAGGMASLSFAAMGSALGTGAAAMAAIGAWKRCYAQNRAAPFLLLAFIGAPLTQTFYGLILMGALKGAAEKATGANYPALLMAGVAGGMAMGFSAWMQGRAAAGAADALAETGKGFANYMIALGIIETVALFVMVFLMMAI